MARQRSTHARIGIDCRLASTGTGLGRYTRELVTHLLKRNDDVQYTLFLSGSDDRSWLPSNTTTRYSLRTTHSKHYSLSEQLKFPFLLKSSGIDLFFCPHFNVPLVCPVPFVATIHDLILHRYPNEASALKQRAYRAVMRHAVKKSKALIAVSNFTASEVVAQYGKQIKKKMTVIHEAVGQEFAQASRASCPPVLKKYALHKPFFLYVGNAKEHKNVQMLIDAYRSLGSTETELVLVTGGRESEGLRLCDGVRHLKNVTDAELPCLYHFAVCFVTASLYEGFGLTVVEAQASGCPSIVTDCGALPEVAPPGSKIVEPTLESIAEALADPPQPSDPGMMKTWEKVAEETFAVLEACF